MIHFIFGGFGSGKSYAGMRAIRSELLNGNRPIVTNLAVMEKDLARYFSENYSRSHVVLHQRLRLLNDDEMANFFVHRVSRSGLWYDIPLPSPEEEKRGVRPDWTQLRDNGCLFIIEEAHEFFGAYQWQEVGRSFRAYKNQNRKFNDDILLITPNLGEIDKQLRLSGQSYTQLINAGKRKIRGIKMPDVFIAREFTTIPQPTSVPSNVYTYGLDVKLANCYDTAKGVRGVQGSLADKEAKVRGVPWWVPVALFVLLGVGLFLGPFIFRKKIARGFTHSFAGVETNPSKAAAAVVGAVTGRERVGGSQTVPVASRVSESNSIVCRGYMVWPGGVTVFLSDGRTADSADGDVEWVHRNRVKVFGEEFPVKALYPEMVAQPASLGNNLPVAAYPGGPLPGGMN